MTWSRHLLGLPINYSIDCYYSIALKKPNHYPFLVSDGVGVRGDMERSVGSSSSVVGPPPPSSSSSSSAAAASRGPGGASQHYSLRWNNHQHHLLSAFDSLLQVCGQLWFFLGGKFYLFDLPPSSHCPSGFSYYRSVDIYFYYLMFVNIYGFLSFSPCLWVSPVLIFFISFSLPNHHFVVFKCQ